MPRPKPTLRCTTLTTSSTITLAASESGASTMLPWLDGIEVGGVVTHDCTQAGTQDGGIQQHGRRDFASEIARVEIDSMAELARIDRQPVLQANQLAVGVNPPQVKRIVAGKVVAAVGRANAVVTRS